MEFVLIEKKKHYTNKTLQVLQERCMVLQQHTVGASGLLQIVRAGCPKEDVKDKWMLMERQWVMRREETACGDSGGQNHKTNIDAGIIITLKAQGRHSKGNG